MFADRADRFSIQFSLFHHPRRIRCDLLKFQDSLRRQFSDRRRAHLAVFRRGFDSDDFVRCVARSRTNYAVFAPGRFHPIRTPSVSFRRFPAQLVQDTRNFPVVVSLGQLANQFQIFLRCLFHDGRLRLGHPELRVNPALPVNHKVERFVATVTLLVHDDLLHDRSNQLLLQGCRAIKIFPHTWKTFRQSPDLIFFFPGQAFSIRRMLPETFFQFTNRFQFFIPAFFQFIGHQAVSGIDGIVLLERPFCRIPGIFQLGFEYAGR